MLQPFSRVEKLVMDPEVCFGALVGLGFGLSSGAEPVPRPFLDVLRPRKDASGAEFRLLFALLVPVPSPESPPDAPRGESSDYSRELLGNLGGGRDPFGTTDASQPPPPNTLLD